MLKGTVLVSPEDKHPYFAFFVKNQIQDNRPTQSGEPNISNELLTLICQNEDGVFQQTSPAKLLDLCPPVEFAKEIVPPEPANENEVVEWAYSHQTEPLLEATEKMVKEDTESRREYLQTAFQQIILDIQGEINELQNKILFSDDEKVQQKLMMKEARYNALKVRKKERLAQLDNMIELFPVEPEVLGCAYVLPLNQVEYRNTFGMSRDDEVEAIAMKVAMDYETEHGRKDHDQRYVHLLDHFDSPSFLTAVTRSFSRSAHLWNWFSTRPMAIISSRTASVSGAPGDTAERMRYSEYRSRYFACRSLRISPDRLRHSASLAFSTPTVSPSEQRLTRVAAFAPSAFLSIASLSAARSRTSIAENVPSSDSNASTMSAHASRSSAHVPSGDSRNASRAFR